MPNTMLTVKEFRKEIEESIKRATSNEEHQAILKMYFEAWLLGGPR